MRGCCCLLLLLLLLRARTRCCIALASTPSRTRLPVAREVYLQHMQAHGGSIVNIIADMWHGMPGMGHSGAARAGMLNFTQTASLEWAPVRVNCVAPGWIASSGLDKC